MGDDDQAIYSWMGVDVNNFLNASESKHTLVNHIVFQNIHLLSPKD